MTELAEAVWDAAHSGAADANLLYEDELSTVDKVERISERLFNADGVDWGPLTKTTARQV